MVVAEVSLQKAPIENGTGSSFEFRLPLSQAVQRMAPETAQRSDSNPARTDQRSNFRVEGKPERSASMRPVTELATVGFDSKASDRLRSVLRTRA
jgi:hypothetical protein